VTPASDQTGGRSTTTATNSWIDIRTLTLQAATTLGTTSRDPDDAAAVLVVILLGGAAAPDVIASATRDVTPDRAGSRRRCRDDEVDEIRSQLRRW
jgi:hypothetical protein